MFVQRTGDKAAQHKNMVPRLRYGAAAARGVGGPRDEVAERSVQPASGQTIPGGRALHHGWFINHIQFES